MFQANIGRKFVSPNILDNDADTVAKKSIKKSATLNSWIGLWKAEEEDLALGYEWGSWFVRPEMATETTEVHKYWGRAGVQRNEQRS